MVSLRRIYNTSWLAKFRISLFIQERKLKLMFPNSIANRDNEKRLEWEGAIKPTPLSAEYKIKLIYDIKRDYKVDVYVKDPHPLRMAKNKTELPHVYSTKKQKLCLYYPKNKEWHKGLLFTETIIPWASEWLAHYELWVVTGEWHGGGIH